VIAGKGIMCYGSPSVSLYIHHHILKFVSTISYKLLVGISQIHNLVALGTEMNWLYFEVKSFQSSRSQWNFPAKAYRLMVHRGRPS